MSYDPVQHWREEGTTYLRDFPGGPAFELQEERLRSALDDLSFHSVLEVGCGFGRITSLIWDRFGPLPITALDVSPDQIAAARRLVSRADFVETPLLDFHTALRWDLVVAVEVLMHQPPDQIAAVVRHMRSLARRYLVTVDWSPAGSMPDVVAPGNFAHDYAALFGVLVHRERVGGQTIWVTRP